MPINSGAYVNPGWVNDTTPYLDADELNAMSNTLAQVPVKNGGTGKTSHTTNALLAGNNVSAVKNIATGNGALYATGANALPQFGVLPVAQGGTGSTGVSSVTINDTFFDGKIYKWGKVVYVSMLSKISAEEINYNNYIPDGYRPAKAIVFTCVGGTANEYMNFNGRTVGAAFISNNGTIRVLGTESKNVYWKVGVTYITND